MSECLGTAMNVNRLSHGLLYCLHHHCSIIVYNVAKILRPGCRAFQNITEAFQTGFWGWRPRHCPKSLLLPQSPWDEQDWGLYIYRRKVYGRAVMKSCPFQQRMPYVEPTKTNGVTWRGIGHLSNIPVEWSWILEDLGKHALICMHAAAIGHRVLRQCDLNVLTASCYLCEVRQVHLASPYRQSRFCPRERSPPNTIAL